MGYQGGIAGFGDRVEARRRHLNLSRADLARRIGGRTNESHVRHWESGTRPQNEETLKKIAVALEVDPAWLLTGLGDPEGGGPAETELSPDERLDLEAWRGLAEEARAPLRQIVGLLRGRGGGGRQRAS